MTEEVISFSQKYHPPVHWVYRFYLFQCDLAKYGMANNERMMDMFVEENGFLKWFEASAKTGNGVEEAFNFIVKEVPLHYIYFHYIIFIVQLLGKTVSSPLKMHQKRKIGNYIVLIPTFLESPSRSPSLYLRDRVPHCSRWKSEFMSRRVCLI